ncbi:MAG: hypothetical protein D4R67_09650 [Bacteroidetes bacterium]|nr:MAG: hypothetical protein D4R67_09650 [Bacteroidota bacterium]
MGKYRNTSSRIFAYALLIINLLAVISLFCSYAAQYIDPHESWIFAVFGLLYPWILIVNVCFIILWLILWKKYALISLIAILIGWKELNTMISLPGENPILLPGPNFNLMTWNLHGFAGQMNVSGDVRPEVTEYLNAESADLVCLQEFYIREAESDPVIQKMARMWGLPYYYVADYYHTGKLNEVIGIATFSRFPIVRRGSLSHQPRNCFCIFTDVVLDQDTIRIFNVHLASLRLGQKDINFYYQLKKNETDNVNLRAGFFSILKKLKQAFQQRATETDKLQEAISQSPYPVIVCGDLNDSPFSYTYRQLTRNLTDAYREAGEGFFGSTYDGAFPNYRIDYIFYDTHFKAFSYKKSDVQFSDHYPVSGLIMISTR